MNRAIRILTSTLGVICGISGLEHGFFETLQGNITPVFHQIGSRSVIYAIGEANQFWKYGTEPAYTIIPSYLITGILAMIVSLFVIIWSAGFLQKKYGWIIFIILSIIQYFVGGGAAQIGLAIFMGLAAIFINAPLSWLRAILPSRLLRILGVPWAWLFIVMVIVFCQSMVTAVFGFLYGIHDPEVINQFLFGVLYAMIGLMPLAILSAFAKDSQQEATATSVPVTLERGNPKEQL